jgi:hypothetical protein
MHVRSPTRTQFLDMSLHNCIFGHSCKECNLGHTCEFCRTKLCSTIFMTSSDLLTARQALQYIRTPAPRLLWRQRRTLVCYMKEQMEQGVVFDGRRGILGRVSELSARRLNEPKPDPLYRSRSLSESIDGGHVGLTRFDSPSQFTSVCVLRFNCSRFYPSAKWP